MAPPHFLLQLSIHFKRVPLGISLLWVRPTLFPHLPLFTEPIRPPLPLRPPPPNLFPRDPPETEPETSGRGAGKGKAVEDSCGFGFRGCRLLRLELPFLREASHDQENRPAPKRSTGPGTSTRDNYNENHYSHRCSMCQAQG